MFNEIGNNFDNDNEMISFFNNYLRSKHDFLKYNKDSDKWYDSNLYIFTLKITEKQKDKVRAFDVRDFFLPYKSMISVGSTHSNH